MKSQNDCHILLYFLLGNGACFNNNYISLKKFFVIVTPIRSMYVIACIMVSVNIMVKIHYVDVGLSLDSVSS